MQHKLMQHQGTSADLFRIAGHRGLLYEMGGGKTLAALTCYVETCHTKRAVLPALIICPSSVVENWFREILKFYPTYAQYVQKLEGHGKERIKQLYTPGKRIFITNTEAISQIKDLWNAILTFHCHTPFDFLIVDESHRFKEPRSIRTKAILRISDRIPYKLILTGTPVLNNEMDLWAQLRILKRGLVDDNFYTWRARYFTNDNASQPWLKFPKWKLRPTSLPHIQQLLHANCCVVKKSECLDLPPLVRQTHFVELTPEAAKHYREMEKTFITSIKNETVAADLHITQLLRLQQIVSGILPREDGGVHSIPTEKIGVLSEILEDLTPKHKVIVWASFRACIEDISTLCDGLEIPHVTIQGGQLPSVRQAAIDCFNENDDIRVCIANQQAGGVGISLTAASYMVYFAKNYNLEHDVQSEARAHRPGSEVHESITRIDLITRDTVEEEITEALRAKLQLGELVTKLRRKYVGGSVEESTSHAGDQACDGDTQLEKARDGAEGNALRKSHTG
jgi:SNF2 family DNA or RNA helicase